MVREMEIKKRGEKVEWSLKAENGKLLVIVSPNKMKFKINKKCRWYEEGKCRYFEDYLNEDVEERSCQNCDVIVVERRCR